jgi:hypothetical protein
MFRDLHDPVLAMLACGNFNWAVIRRELRQPITFEEV